MKHIIIFPLILLTSLCLGALVIPYAALLYSGVLK